MLQLKGVSAMQYTVSVDLDVCDSFGICVAAAPTVFDLDEDDQLVVLNHEVDESGYPAVADAATRCPKRAITLSDMST
jgi:ferredoxin